MPQAFTVSVVMHWPLALQQPLGHVFWSQTHLPWALHSWFAPHAWHVTPPAPHAELEAVTHVPVESQHPEHEALPQVHAPPEHVWPFAQLPQALPWLPHFDALWPACSTHVLFEQHPVAHDVGSQVHTPATHSVPEPHAVHAAPPLPH
jgi:hypothetical protein